jgi:glutamine amidotransferase
MCELFGFSSRVPTTVSFSLAHFAERGGLGGKTLDGWGLAFYEGRDLRLFREPEPARDSTWLPFIHARQIPAALVISHIRHATRGDVSLSNTQPFVREIRGRMHCFAHNGKLADIDHKPAFESGSFKPVGRTDSEIAACALFDRMSGIWQCEAAPTPEQRLAAVQQFAAELRALGPANFLYSDGELLFGHAHRRTQTDGSISPPGLWVLERQCAVDPDVLSASGVRIGTADGEQELVLLASVPLTEEPWRALQEGEVVVIHSGAVISLSGIDHFQTAASIRLTALQLHAGIREALHEVAHIASQARNGDMSCLEELRAALQRLAAAVREHNVEERKVLDPYLAKVDAWGQERVDRLRKERRAELQFVSSKVAELDAATLIQTACGLIRPLARLLQKEEREALPRDLLRDDAIAIDQEDA